MTLTRKGPGPPGGTGYDDRQESERREPDGRRDLGRLPRDEDKYGNKDESKGLKSKMKVK